MNTTRNGKIARLPRELRDQLSQRIDNGQPGRKLVAWLNSLPEVQTILAEQFDSRPINTQNITEWRQGGYQEWFELQENRALTLRLAEQSGTLTADAGATKLSEHFATIATARFVRTAETVLKKTTDPRQSLACLDNILRQLSRLRRDDYRAGHLKLRQDTRNDHLAIGKKADELAAHDDRRRQMLAYFKLQPKIVEETRQRGGTDRDRDVAAFVLELEHNLGTGLLGRTLKESVTDDFEEFDEIATRNEVAQGLTSDPAVLYGESSEGRIPRVPNNKPSMSQAPNSNTPIESTPTPATARDTANNLSSTQYEILPIQPPINPAPGRSPEPETTQKAPGIRVNQAAGEPSKNPERN